ncbi:hypothetical protein [Acetobacter persici]|uniref:hypothetical protein n=1 Tax=Acetobacter persici TaxID=1076596 RepID=UPI0039EBD3E1
MPDSAPTNWPNPERPGVPMFPEKRGWHMMDRDVWEWCPTRQAWNDTVLHPIFVKAKDMAWRKYHGSVLTPTQISEMLAGERERCAEVCEDNSVSMRTDCKDTETALNEMLETTAREIRNLGAAS